MPAVALIDVLPDFGTPRPAAARPVEVPRPAEPAPPAPPASMVERFSREELDTAVSKAVALVQAQLAEEHARTAAEAAARHGAEIEKLRADAGEAAGRMIAERLAAAAARLEATTSAAVARILGVALTAEMEKTALAELSTCLRDALADRDAVRLRVSGPPSMLERLRRELGDHARGAEFLEAPGLDLSVAIDDVLFETRLAEWSRALNETFA